MLNEIFSDCFAQRENYLTKIDARIKISFVLSSILIILFSRTSLVSISFIFLSLGALLSVNVPLKIIFLRLIAPLGIATVILFLQIFFYGTTPIIKLNFIGFDLIGYKEGWSQGLLIMGKVMGSVSLVLFLSTTTSFNKCLYALAWFKIPVTFVEVGLMTYRYIFVLLEDAIRVGDAQKIRLGYSNLRRSLRSVSELIGTVVIRAYAQSATTYEAMIARGYKGNMCNIFYKQTMGFRDIVTAFIFIAILVIFFGINFYFAIPQS